MMQIKKLLMPTDFSPCANAALTFALFLAEQFGATIYILHVVELYTSDPANPEEDFPGADEISQRLQEVAHSGMRRLIDSRSVDRIEIIERQRRAISAAPEIVEFAEQEQIDLIVIGSHGRRGLKRFLLGSVTEEVVQHAACPVLTIPAPDGDAEIERIDRMVVPIDFSAPARAALHTAFDLAKIYGSSVDVIHVVDPPIFPPPYAMLAAQAQNYTFPQMAAEVEKGLTELIGEIGNGEVETHIQVLSGNAPRSISDYAAETGADLIVMSTRGLTGIEHFLIGSVAEKVLRSTSCPVLTLKPPAEAAT